MLIHDSLVEVGSFGAVDVVPPITVEGFLVEDGTVGAEELRTLRTVPIIVTDMVQLKKKEKKQYSVTTC